MFSFADDMNTVPTLLFAPIESLPFSSELKLLLSSHGYLNLQDILQQKISDLRAKNGLDLNDELQLYNLVKENGLVNLWKEE